MHLGSDFFKIVEMVVAILRLFGRIFGDEDDRKADDEVQKNHSHEKYKVGIPINGHNTKSPTKGSA